MSASDVYFAAANAAEAALPASSRALIEEHDRLHGEWRKAGWGELPAALSAATKAIKEDRLANFAMECRRQGNEVAYEEWRAEEEARTQTKASVV